MEVLVPLEITDTVFLAGTNIPYPDSALSEVLWVSGSAYAVDAEVTYGGVVYICNKPVAAGVTTTPPNDPFTWQKKRPANRYAPFDFYMGTKAVANGSVKFVLAPGFFRDVRVDGLVGDDVEITVKDAPGGTVIAHLDMELWEQALGLYELLFMPLLKLESVSLDDIPLAINAELTIEVTSTSPTTQVGIGKISIGEWQSLIGLSKFGGSEWGAQAEPKSYSYTKYYDDGTYEYVPRRSAIDLTATVRLDADQANYAMAILKQIQDIPVAVRATKLANYGYLSTVGVVKGSLVAQDYSTAKLQVNVKGFT